MTVKIKRIIRDLEGNNDSWELSFRDVRGDRRTIIVPRTYKSRKRDLLAKLEGASADMRKKNIETIIKELCSEESSAPTCTIINQMGVQTDGHFVSPTFSIGYKRCEYRLNNEDDTKGMKRIGTTLDWSAICDVARYSSVMTLAVLLPFAARTLRAAGLKSFGFFLTGDRKIGKSAALTAGASAIGFGDEDSLLHFNRSNSSLLELLPTFRDHLLPINEAELLLEEGEEGKRKALNKFAYALNEGSSRSFSSTVSRPSKRISTIFLGNLERRPAGNSSGADVRIIYIPAKRDKDPDIFDRAPRGLTPNKRIRWAARLFQRQRDICKANSGQAFFDFCRYLDREQHWVKRLETSRFEFINKYEPKLPSDHASRHVLMLFSHVYASAMIARNAGAITLSKKHIQRCLWYCFRRSQNIESNRSAFQRLLAKVRDGHLPTSEKLANVRSAPGYISTDGDKQTVVIRAAQLVGIIGNEMTALQILQRLNQEGMILTKPKARCAKAKDFEQQINWPNGDRVRSIRISYDERKIRKLLRQKN